MPRTLLISRATTSPPNRQQWIGKKALLLLGLGTLSWISTYTGMLELIQANMGRISFVMQIAIGFAVAMLMLMIIWLLDRLFDRLNFTVRTLFVFGYLFLTLISVGFGFGFYWKFLESRSEASRSAESAVTQVQTALQGAQTRLEQLQTTLASLTTISSQKAIDEREKGNSCPNSRPGDGPRRRLRDADAARFKFASDFASQRVTTVKGDIAVLNKDLAKVVAQDPTTFSKLDGTRNAFLRELSRKLDLSVARFNAFRSDPQLLQFRADFNERAGKTVFDNGKGGTFSCPDPELQTALRGVVRAIDKLPEVEKPKVAAVEGSEAIIEAFRRLTVTIYGAMQLQLPPSPDELRAMQQKAVAIQNNAQQRRILAIEPGLGDRDYVPLFIALFVDFCLLLVSVSRPMNGFQWLDQRMGQAQDWPVIKILSRFRDIHQDEEIREVFDVFRHVVFDWRGIYYAAVPMNGTDPSYGNKINEESAVQAQLLANLFTSFENEKVFVRAPVSFFTTGFIQRKLRDQGSKFAEAEAFRIYRFRDRMWQDWMLSAMMGAARRVEARKRQEEATRAAAGHELEVAAGKAKAHKDRKAKDTSEDELKEAMRAVESVEENDTDAKETASVAATDKDEENLDGLLATAVEDAVRETLQTQTADAARRAQAEMELARAQAVQSAVARRHAERQGAGIVAAHEGAALPPRLAVNGQPMHVGPTPLGPLASADALSSHHPQTGARPAASPMPRAANGQVAPQPRDEKSTAAPHVIPLPGRAVPQTGRMANASVPPAGDQPPPTSPTFRTRVRTELPPHISPQVPSRPAPASEPQPNTASAQTNGAAVPPSVDERRARLQAKLEALPERPPAFPGRNDVAASAPAEPHVSREVIALPALPVAGTNEVDRRPVPAHRSAVVSPLPLAEPANGVIVVDADLGEEDDDDPTSIDIKNLTSWYAKRDG